MSEDEIDEEIVILRRWRKRDGGGVIALWPNQRDGWTVQSFEHVGQHGPASYNAVISRTTPAYESEPDTAALLAELRDRGYTPNIRMRRP
jgi:hypothetical protein